MTRAIFFALLLLARFDLGYTAEDVGSSCAEDDRVTRGFMEWIRAAGVDTSRYEIVETTEGRGRGVRATSDFDSGEISVRIPASIVIDENVARRELLSIGEVGRGETSSLVVKNFVDTLDSCDAVVVFLANERRRAGSFWRPYIEILPSMPKIPLMTNLSVLARALRPSESVFRSMEEKFRDFERKARAIGTAYKSIYGGETFEDDFRWAYAQLLSRAWRVSTMPGTGQATARPSPRCFMLPLIDMLNHQEVDSGNPVAIPVTSSTGEDGDNENDDIFDVGVVTSRPVKKGESLRQNYHPSMRCNGEILWLYGFVERNNADYDCAFFDVDIAVTTEEDHESKAKELWRLGIPPVAASFVVRASSIDDDVALIGRLRSALRVSAATVRALREVTEKDLLTDSGTAAHFDPLEALAQVLPRQSVLSELRQFRQLMAAVDRRLESTRGARVYHEKEEEDSHDAHTIPTLVGVVLRGEKRALEAFRMRLQRRWWDLVVNVGFPAAAPYALVLNGAAAIIYFRGRIASAAKRVVFGSPQIRSTSRGLNFPAKKHKRRRRGGR